MSRHPHAEPPPRPGYGPRTVLATVGDQEFWTDGTTFPYQAAGCPACGFLSLDEPGGRYDICPVCGWEDDPVQLRYPESYGANRITLWEAQQCRPTESAYPRDPLWRPLTKAECRTPPYWLSGRYAEPVWTELHGRVVHAGLRSRFEEDLARWNLGGRRVVEELPKMELVS